MKNKATIVKEFIDQLKRDGRSVKLILPPVPQPKPKTPDDLKMWLVEGLPRPISNNQLWRWATTRCVVCGQRFVQRPGPGRKRVYCGRRCQNRAHYRKHKFSE